MRAKIVQEGVASKKLVKIILFLVFQMPNTPEGVLRSVPQCWPRSPAVAVSSAMQAKVAPLCSDPILSHAGPI